MLWRPVREPGWFGGRNHPSKITMSNATSNVVEFPIVSDRVQEFRTHSATWISITHSYVRHSLVPTRLYETKTSPVLSDGLVGNVRMIGRSDLPTSSWVLPTTCQRLFVFLANISLSSCFADSGLLCRWGFLCYSKPGRTLTKTVAVRSGDVKRSGLGQARCSAHPFTLGLHPCC